MQKNNFYHRLFFDILKLTLTNSPNAMVYRSLKISFFLFWILLLILLIRRDILIPEMQTSEAILLKQARQENYYGVWFKQDRIGYIVERLRPDPKDTKLFMLEQQGLLNLKVANTMQPISMKLEGHLDGQMHLQDFSFTFSSAFYQMKANGKVTGNGVDFTLDTGQTIIRDSITFDRRPLLPLNQRPWLAEQLPEVGDKRKISFFDPLSLEPRTATIEYHGRDKQLIQGRVHNLHEYSEQFSGMRTRFYTDDQGKIIKESSPAGFVFLAEPKFKATDISRGGDELLQAVAVPYTGKIPSTESTVARYKLTLPEDVSFDLDGGRQQLLGNTLILHKESIPDHSLPTNNNPCEEEKALQASRYIQADDPLIQKTTAEIIGPVKDQARQVRLLAEFVYKTLEKRPVLGLPDALTSLQAKKGDCNEHAALFAALARAAGIPTAIATGVTLHRNRFYYHAWNEVCLNGIWYSLDTTTNQIPADLMHIRFGRGDMDQQLKIGSLLGKLRIEIL